MMNIFEELKNLFFRTIPMQTFFIFLWFAPDRFVSIHCFPSLYHGVFYYWLVYRPESLSLFPLLIGTIFFDVAQGEASGQTFLELFCMMVGVLSQRKYLISAPFIVTWACFVFCMVILVICTLCAHYTENNILLIFDLLYSFIWVSLAYPSLSWLLEKTTQSFHHLHA